MEGIKEYGEAINVQCQLNGEELRKAGHQLRHNIWGETYLNEYIPKKDKGPSWLDVCETHYLSKANRRYSLMMMQSRVQIASPDTSSGEMKMSPFDYDSSNFDEYTYENGETVCRDCGCFGACKKTSPLCRTQSFYGTRNCNDINPQTTIQYSDDVTHGAPPMKMNDRARRTSALSKPRARYSTYFLRPGPFQLVRANPPVEAYQLPPKAWRQEIPMLRKVELGTTDALDDALSEKYTLLSDDVSSMFAPEPQGDSLSADVTESDTVLFLSEGPSTSQQSYALDNYDVYEQGHIGLL